jgi:hypothetical protein
MSLRDVQSSGASWFAAWPASGCPSCRLTGVFDPVLRGRERRRAGATLRVRPRGDDRAREVTRYRDEAAVEGEHGGSLEAPESVHQCSATRAPNATRSTRGCASDLSTPVPRRRRRLVGADHGGIVRPPATGSGGAAPRGPPRSSAPRSPRDAPLGLSWLLVGPPRHDRWARRDQPRRPAWATSNASSTTRATSMRLSK